MTLNGERVEWSEGMTVGGLLRAEGYGTDRVAVEKNGSIVPRASYEAVSVEENDSIEVVRFVGGG